MVQGSDSWDQNLMQVWQWLRHKARLDNGQVLTKQLFDRMLEEEMQKMRKWAVSASMNPIQSCILCLQCYACFQLPAIKVRSITLDDAIATMLDLAAKC